MSTVNVATVAAKAAATAPVFEDNASREIGQLCTAWVLYNTTTTTTITDSFNVSSLTDNGTGDTTINFANNMANTTYCVVAGGANSVSPHNVSRSVSSRLVGSVSVQTRAQSTPALNDHDDVSVAIFGGL